MTDHDPLEPQLVAWLHGELDADERRAVDALLRRDADARARLEVLRAADRALREALDSDEVRARSSFRAALRPLLALAATLVVATVFWFARDSQGPGVARNEFLELRLAPRDGGSVPLFTELAFRLHWQLRDTSGRKYEVVPFPFGTTPEQIAASRADSEVGGKVCPLVVTAEVRDPEGKVHQARLAPKESFLIDGERAVQTVSCLDFEIENAAPRPVLWGKPGPGEWLEDQHWRLTNMPATGSARWFPELPGEWRLELRVDTVPPPQPGLWPTFQGPGPVDTVPPPRPGLWPTFPEPLRVSTAVMMTGEASAWSAAHDGMQARLVCSTGGRATGSTPFALQLRNVSDRVRKYNHAGSTIAKIPQPLHFNLLVDGEEWTQRERLPLVIRAVEDLVEPHAAGQVRSFVVRPDWWQRGDRHLGQLPGAHAVQIRFHFEPSIWDGNDKELWMGELLTPPVAIEVPRTGG